MPIIELHGFGKKPNIDTMREMFQLPAISGGDMSEDVGAVFKRIEEETSILSFGKDIMIEIYDSFCVRNRKIKPYIRIVTSNISQAMELVIVLKPIGFSIQVLLSNDYYPADQ